MGLLTNSANSSGRIPTSTFRPSLCSSPKVVAQRVDEHQAPVALPRSSAARGAPSQGTWSSLQCWNECVSTRRQPIRALRIEPVPRVEEDELVVGAELADVVPEILLRTSPWSLLIRPQRDVLGKELASVGRARPALPPRRATRRTARRGYSVVGSASIAASTAYVEPATSPRLLTWTMKRPNGSLSDALATYCSGSRSEIGEFRKTSRQSANQTGNAVDIRRNCFANERVVGYATMRAAPRYGALVG